jgi:hypothetical protein
MYIENFDRPLQGYTHANVLIIYLLNKLFVLLLLLFLLEVLYTRE